MLCKDPVGTCKMGLEVRPFIVSEATGQKNVGRRWMGLGMRLEEKGQIQRHIERNLMEAGENLEEPE